MNTSSLWCARIAGNIRKAEPEIMGFTRSIRRPNFEARVIGLQNGENTGELMELLRLLERERLQVFEVDLFGADTRHIAMDAKVGMSFNILMEDRLYKPGELQNRLTEDQFERALSALTRKK